MKMHEPQINDFGGAPVAEHDVACPVCWTKKAVLEMGSGVFQACWDCQSAGWKTVQLTPLRRLCMMMFGPPKRATRR